MDRTGISLFKRNGIYYIVYTDESGTRKQKSTRCKHKPEAMIVLSRLTKFLAEERKHKSVSLTSFMKDFGKIRSGEPEQIFSRYLRTDIAELHSHHR